jgi:hypothetical protein
MTLDGFRKTLTASAPPAVATALQALWHDAKGDWDKAHETADSVEDQSGYWVHAYLHRKEGNPGNAAYWYDLAKEPVATDSLEAEWARIAKALLERV